MGYAVEVFSRSTDIVRGALQEIILENGWSAETASSVGIVRFHTGMSFWTFSGQDVTVELERDDGDTRVRVTTAIRRTLFTKLAATDWGEGDRIARRVTEGIRERIRKEGMLD